MRNRCAVNYCVECQQCYCEQCSVWHTRTKSTSNHALVLLGRPLDLDALLTRLGPAACHVHRTEDVSLYCCDCDAPICYVCYARSRPTQNSCAGEKVRTGKVFFNFYFMKFRVI